jgi:hypothetical protein
MQHDVDQVFQRPGPGDGSVLGDMADENQRHTGGFRCGGQRRGHRAHLGDTAGDAVGVSAGHGLHRVDDDERGLHHVDMAEHCLQVGLGGQVQLVMAAAGPVGAHADLATGLLAGDIQRAPTGRCPLMSHLEQQRRLSDARIAREQGDRARYHAAAQHTVEFVDTGRTMAGAARIDGTDRNRSGGRG